MKPSSRSRERSRKRHLRVALTLLTFALAVLFGGVGLLVRAAAVGGVGGPQAVVTHDGRPPNQSRCGKARAVAHAKHLRPHARSASVDDDDDDDDDGVADSFAIALDQAAMAPATFHVPEASVWELDAAALGPASRPRRSRARSAHEARGPPAA